MCKEKRGYVSLEEIFIPNSYEKSGKPCRRRTLKREIKR